MQAQQHYGNVLFSAAAVNTYAVESAAGSQPGHRRGPIKRPQSIFLKPSRSSRLGAAAAAAAACFDDDSSSGPDLDDCLINPETGSGATADDANRLLHSLFGSIPALPGSPTLDSPDTPLPLQLVARSSGVTSSGFRGHAASPGATFSGCCGQTGSPTGGGRRLAKSHSARAAGGAAITYDSGATAATAAALDRAVAARRTLARNSIDAAAGAEVLATRQISVLSAAAPSEDSATGEALRGAVDAAAAAAASRGHPAAVAAQAPATPAAAVCRREHLPGSPVDHLGSSAQMAAPASPFATFQSMRMLRLGSNSPRTRAQSCAGVGEGPREAGGGSGTGAGGAGPRRRETEGRQLPRWFSRILRALNVETVTGGGRVSAVDGGGSSSGGGGVGGGRDGDVTVVTGRASPKGEVGIGGSGGGGCGGSVQVSDGGCVSDRVIEGAVARAGGRIEGGGGEGGGTSARDERGGDGGGGTGGAAAPITNTASSTATAATAAAVAAATAAATATASRSRVNTISRGPRDQFAAAASRLLSSRLGRHSRSGEMPPSSVMASRDSTTVHRARLAQQAKAAGTVAAVAFAAAPSPNQSSAAFGQSPFDTGTDGLNDAVATTYTRKLSAAGAAAANPTAAATATTSAPATGVSVTALAQAVAAASGSAAAAEATEAATASDFSGAVDHLQMPLREPAETGSVRPAVRVGRGSTARVRQFSAPGGPEMNFTPLSQIDTPSVDVDMSAVARAPTRRSPIAGRYWSFRTVASASGDAVIDRA